MKNKSLKTAAILALTVVGLGLLATWDEWKTKKEEQEKTQSTSLTTLKPEQVSGIEYEALPDEPTADAKGTASKGPVHAILKKENGKWMVVKPVDGVADEQTINDLVKTVFDYKFEKTLSHDKSEWAAFGLEKPRRKISFQIEGQDAGTFTVYIGNNTPVGYSVYLATSKSNDVFLGGQHLATSTNKTLHDFRDKKLFNLTVNDITTIAYQREKDAPIDIQRKDGLFQVVKPQVIDTDNRSVTNFVEDLNQIKVSEFVDSPSNEQKALFKDQKRFAKVAIQLSKGNAQTMVFALQKDKLLGAFDSEKRIFILSDDAKQKLSKTVKEFRNKQVFDFKVAEVKSVEVDGNTFGRAGEDWYASQDLGKFDAAGKFTGKETEKPEAKTNIRSFLVDLEFAKFDDILDLGSPTDKKLSPSPKNRIVITFSDESKKPALTIDVWADPTDGEKTLVKRTGGKGVYKLPKSVFSSLAPKPPQDTAGKPEELPPGTLKQ